MYLRALYVSGSSWTCALRHSVEYSTYVYIYINADHIHDYAPISMVNMDVYRGIVANCFFLFKLYKVKVGL